MKILNLITLKYLTKFYIYNLSKKLKDRLKMFIKNRKFFVDYAIRN